MRTPSPLRYPGGKACLYPLIASILKANRLERRHYAEPFAGGCGLALLLLYNGHVCDVHINDIDPGVWAFWYSVLNEAEALIDLVLSADVTVDEWHRQREISLLASMDDPVELGFATFFLNRTSRSGIVRGAGVIGGLGQTGPYKINCRFNKLALINQIRRLVRYRSRVHLTRLDAIEFISQVRESSGASFLYVDPPYFRRGARLYTSFYEPEDHAELASSLLVADTPWVLTYDNEREIRYQYSNRRQFELSVKYSIETKRLGTEILVPSKGLRLPSELGLQRLPKLRARKTNKQSRVHSLQDSVDARRR